MASMKFLIMRKFWHSEHSASTYATVFGACTFFSFKHSDRTVCYCGVTLFRVSVCVMATSESMSWWRKEPKSTEIAEAGRSEGLRFVFPNLASWWRQTPVHDVVDVQGPTSVSLGRAENVPKQVFDLVPPYALTDGVGEAFRRGRHLSQTSLVNYRLTEHVLIYTSGKSSVADRGGGVLGSATPFLAHDVGFLTLGPKAGPPPWEETWNVGPPPPLPSKILHSSYIAQISFKTFNLNVNLESKNVYNKKAKSNYILSSPSRLPWQQGFQR